ncbi:hypothetical protein K470DRAFT_43682 [Piedraia hortae CBS 480.64]|uniref:Uncharacterized protein n=1 Tax=Piedraia hortae CBS 480.64 TaxID=1314780 RepID=A0A6A7C1S3_9PEZI|nr:hypothetical protein K470DRAFT_43682 [Piedraia hortae CBS 480.64]
MVSRNVYSTRFRYSFFWLLVNVVVSVLVSSWSHFTAGLQTNTLYHTGQSMPDHTFHACLSIVTEGAQMMWLLPCLLQSNRLRTTVSPLPGCQQLSTSPGATCSETSLSASDETDAVMGNVPVS